MLHLIFVSIWTRFIPWEWMPGKQSLLWVSVSIQMQPRMTPPARTLYDNSSGTCVKEVWSDIQYIAGRVSQNQGSDAQKRPHSPLSLCNSWEEDGITACKSPLALFLVTLIVERDLYWCQANCALVLAQPLILIVTAPLPCLLGTRLSISHNDDLM